MIPPVRGKGILGVLAGLTLASCSSPSNFACSEDTQCVSGGVSGFCEDAGYCSFPDPSCPSGRRYGNAAPDLLAQTCVDRSGSSGMVDTGAMASTSTSTTVTPSSEASSDATTSSTTAPATTDPTTSTSTSSTSSAESSSESTGVTEPCPTTADADTVALYRFDSDEAFLDDVGTVDGVWRDGIPTLVPGPLGCGLAVQFAGGLDALVPHDAVFDLSEGSIDFWLRAPADPMPMGVISRDALDQVFDGHLTAWYVEGRIVVRNQSTMLSQTICSDGALPAETWVHVGINFGPPGLELYIDGEAQDGVGEVFIGMSPTNCVDEDLVTVGIAGNTNPLIVGASLSMSMKGMIDEVLPLEDGALDELRVSSVRRDF